MKLLKKIIPLTVLATAATVVTPMVASCSRSSAWDIDWSRKDGTWLPDGEIHKAVEGGMTLAAASQDYFDALEDNPEIFAQDLAYAYFYSYAAGGSIFSTLESLKVKVNSLVEDEDLSTDTMPVFRVTFKMHIEIQTGDYAGAYDTYDLEYNNVPYCIVDSSDQDPLGDSAFYCSLIMYGITAEDGLSFEYTGLRGLDDWSIDVSYSNLVSSAESTIDYNDLPTNVALVSQLTWQATLMGAIGIESIGDLLPYYHPTYYMCRVTLQNA